LPYNLVSAREIILEYFLFDKAKSAVFPEQTEHCISLLTDRKASHILEILMPGPVAFLSVGCWEDKTTIVIIFCSTGLQQH